MAFIRIFAFAAIFSSLLKVGVNIEIVKFSSLTNDLYRRYEETLVGDENLYWLRQAFYGRYHSQSFPFVSIHVHLSQYNITGCKYANHSTNKRRCTLFRFEWVSPELSRIIHSRCAIDLLYTIEPVSIVGLLPSADRARVDLNLQNIDNLYQIATHEEVVQVIADLMSWVSIRLLHCMTSKLIVVQAYRRAILIRCHSDLIPPQISYPS